HRYAKFHTLWSGRLTVDGPPSRSQRVSHGSAERQVDALVPSPDSQQRGCGERGVTHQRHIDIAPVSGKDLAKLLVVLHPWRSGHNDRVRGGDCPVPSGRLGVGCREIFNLPAESLG